MFQSIQIIKDLGYIPDTIFDIGADHGKWTQQCKEIFNTSRYHLFEDIYYPELFSIANGNTRIYNCVLNDCLNDVDLKKISTTLDSISNTHEILNNSTNIFIKIDCQGAEIPILKGATNVLKKTDFILFKLPFFGQYNAGAPNFLEHIQFMDSIGFVPFDFCESHYIDGFTIQVDIIFIRKDHPFSIEVDTKLRNKSAPCIYNISK